jgi:hypothetical protein
MKQSYNSEGAPAKLIPDFHLPKYRRGLQDAKPGGKLDRLMETATKEYKAGKSLPFPKSAE